MTELSICGMLGKLGCQCTVGYDITIGFSKKHSLMSKWYFPTITIPLWIQNSSFHENWNVYFLSNLHLQIFIHWGCRHQTDTWYNTRKTFCGLFLVQTVSYGKLEFTPLTKIQSQYCFRGDISWIVSDRIIGGFAVQKTGKQNI